MAMTLLATVSVYALDRCTEVAVLLIGLAYSLHSHGGVAGLFVLGNAGLWLDRRCLLWLTYIIGRVVQKAFALECHAFVLALVSAVALHLRLLSSRSRAGGGVCVLLWFVSCSSRLTEIVEGAGYAGKQPGHQAAHD